MLPETFVLTGSRPVRTPAPNSGGEMGLILVAAANAPEWSQRRDSNPQPPDYKSGALPIEPRWQAIAEGAQRSAAPLPDGWTRLPRHRGAWPGHRLSDSGAGGDGERRGYGPRRGMQRGTARNSRLRPSCALGAARALPEAARAARGGSPQTASIRRRHASNAARVSSMWSPPNFSRKAAASSSATTASPTTLAAGTDVTSERW